MTSSVQIAVKAARKAEKVLSRYFLKRNQARRVGLEFKAEADKAADQVIYNAIKKSFPSHSILTEERAREKKFGEYTWVVDPIDGTTNFICGFPLWAISIGLVHNGIPLLAVTNIPKLNKLYVAQKGKGARCNNKKIKVDSITDLKRSNITLDIGYHPQRSKLYAQMIQKLGDNVGNISIINSICTSFPLIASRNLQGLIHYTVTPWEFPTGTLILEEAGGKVTDLKGQKITYKLTRQKPYNVIASNNKIHSKLVKLLS